MKLIPLTKGMFAQVDDADFDALSGIHWQSTITVSTFYAACADSEHKRAYMHRIILCAPKHLDVDHIDGNGLNNTRANLRLSTMSQNQANRGKQINNKSGYKGVCPSSPGKPWRAGIRVRGQKINLGSFDSPEAAARAYDAAARQYFGEFAFANFPRD